MEMSAAFALCEYLEVPCVGLFVVSDAHDLTERIDWKWNKQLFEEKLENSLNLLMELTELF
jgi:nucleoside phosphorylase